jgi:TRAP-type mannitol/chloroaromatic compound transport system substrate-binding protein
MQWSPEILATYETTWNEVVKELAADDPFFQKVWSDLQDYRKGYSVWAKSIYLPRE